jgi:ABC-type glycerol-3-phosphate transport system substrate-binding protein
MKKNMIGFFTVLIIIGLFGAGFTGCENKPDNKLENSAISEIVMKKLEPATLNFYFLGTQKPDVREVLDEIEKKTVDSLNVKLNFKWAQWNEYNSKIRGLGASGEDIDVFECFKPDLNPFDSAQMAR